MRRNRLFYFFGLIILFFQQSFSDTLDISTTEMKESLMSTQKQDRDILSHETISETDQIISWQKKLESFGPRFTGNKAHVDFVNWLKSELSSMGLEVHTDTHSFKRWEEIKSSLSISDSTGVNNFPLLSCYPYSGKTASNGVSAELVFCGKGPGKFKKASGKIAIVEVNNPGIPRSIIFKKRHAYPSHDAKIPFLIRNTVISSVLKGPDLKKAKQAGVLGVIAVWKGISEENVCGQYLPFTSGYKDCPAVWVSKKTGKELISLAGQKRTATLVLDATYSENEKSETIYASLTGNNDSESIIINTHTDGPNACEENGAVGLLAIARHLSQMPVQERARTTHFVFVTGHFQLPQFGIHGQATTRWLQNHPELWDGNKGNQKAVASLSIEHLGCKQWADNKKHTEFNSTGKTDLEYVYTGNKFMESVFAKSITGRKKIRTVTLRPKNNFYFGEGQPFYKSGVPTISLIPAPEYLCSVKDNGHADKIDHELLLEQINTFKNAYSIIDKTVTYEIGKTQKQYFNIFALFLKEDQQDY